MKQDRRHYDNKHKFTKISDLSFFGLRWKTPDAWKELPTFNFQNSIHPRNPNKFIIVAHILNLYCHHFFDHGVTTLTLNFAGLLSIKGSTSARQNESLFLPENYPILSLIIQRVACLHPWQGPRMLRRVFIIIGSARSGRRDQ